MAPLVRKWVAPLGCQSTTVSVDDGQASDSEAVIVTLRPIEELPSISFQSVDEANALDPVTVVADATDTDGNISSYFWSQVSGTEVVFAGQGTNAITFQAPFEFEAQTMQFDLIVEDSEGELNSNSIEVQIAEGQIGYQSSSTNVYDDLGRLITVSKTIDSRTLTTNYTYDEAGNILTVTIE